MASLNLLVGYGSDADSSEEEISCIANPSTNQIVNPDEQERKVKQNNFFDADDSSSSKYSIYNLNKFCKPCACMF